MKAKSRNAASWPFQIFDCHMRNHSPPTVMKAKYHWTSPAVRPTDARPFAFFQSRGGAPRAFHSRSAPAPISAQHRASHPMIVGIERLVNERRVDRAVHARVSGEGRVHAEHVPDELIVGVRVGQVVEHDDEEEHGRQCGDDDLAESELHGMGECWFVLRGWKEAASASSAQLVRSRAGGVADVLAVDQPPRRTRAGSGIR